jgi:hypothetical protein
VLERAWGFKSPLAHIVGILVMRISKLRDANKKAGTGDNPAPAFFFCCRVGCWTRRDPTRTKNVVFHGFIGVGKLLSKYAFVTLLVVVARVLEFTPNHGTSHSGYRDNDCAVVPAFASHTAGTRRARGGSYLFGDSSAAAIASMLAVERA